MTADTLFFYYLILINFLAGIVFSYDKFAAVTKRTRVKESGLHLFEALGGAFAILLLMYVLRHKTQKSLYYMWTWIFMTFWLFGILLVVLM